MDNKILLNFDELKGEINYLYNYNEIDLFIINNDLPGFKKYIIDHKDSCFVSERVWVYSIITENNKFLKFLDKINYPKIETKFTIDMINDRFININLLKNTKTHLICKINYFKNDDGIFELILKINSTIKKIISFK